MGGWEGGGGSNEPPEPPLDPQCFKALMLPLEQSDQGLLIWQNVFWIMDICIRHKK